MLTFSLLRCPNKGGAGGVRVAPRPGLVAALARAREAFGARRPLLWERAGASSTIQDVSSRGASTKRARAKPHPFNAALSASSDEGHVMDETAPGKPKAALPPRGIR